MFDFLAKLLGYVMRGCYWLTNNYVVALLLFALAMQVLLSPFGIKQQRNMVKQASLRPKEMAIRNKYRGRNDKVTMQKMQQEVMDLYKREGYSQFAGCLPLIFQMLIIFPLYRVVIRPLEFVSGLSADLCKVMCGDLKIDPEGTTAQISVIAKLQNDASAFASLSPDAQKAVTELGGVEALPNMTLFGVDLGQDPWSALSTTAWLLVLVPILNLGFMYLSQFLSKKFAYQSPQQQDMNNSMGTMKIMMLILPLMTMFITFKFAAAIGIYWIFRTILSIGQQTLFHYVFPYPKFTEEDYKNAEKALKGKKAKPRAYKNVNYDEIGVRSLHHIDD
ncbi:MAG: YidC/Oxa1 family membrane protein insertase [Clostridia bacterium]|nr:YidC/Oxa1 family membrane protein insertase [Clostridia bacterium]